MDEERRLRYQTKITWIQDRSDCIETWLSETELKKGFSDTKTVLAIFKAYQEVVEACMDLIAMYLRDCDTPPLDDYSNITGLISSRRRRRNCSVR